MRSTSIRECAGRRPSENQDVISRIPLSQINSFRKVTTDDFRSIVTGMVFCARQNDLIYLVVPFRMFDVVSGGTWPFRSAGPVCLHHLMGNTPIKCSVGSADEPFTI